MASPAYRAYLCACGVSYVLAGTRELDLRLALRKLRTLFGIERLLVCGGGSYAFSLKRVERLPGDGLHLVYRTRPM